MNNTLEKYYPRNEHIYTTFVVTDMWIFNHCPLGLYFFVRSKTKNQITLYYPLTEK